MSSVSRRPRVKAISSAVLDSVAVSCATAVGVLVTNAIRSLDKPNRDVGLRSMKTLPQKKMGNILSVPSIQTQMPVLTEGIRHELTQQSVPPVEAAKLATLLSLQTAPYFCEPSVLQVPLKHLTEARSEREVTAASEKLMLVLQQGHQQTLTNALETACKKASVQAGFTSIETANAIDGTLRVIASDTAGRALVTEIRNNAERESSIQTEVVGAVDGACTGILDRFDSALEQQGVVSSSQDRKWTGGVCELEAAKQFLKKKIFPGTAVSKDGRRALKLNPKPKLKA